MTVFTLVLVHIDLQVLKLNTSNYCNTCNINNTHFQKGGMEMPYQPNSLGDEYTVTRCADDASGRLAPDVE